MNCVLQCLAGTPSIAIPFVDGTFRRWVNVNSRLGHKGILAHKFAELVQLMFCESYSYVAPSGLKDLCGRIREQFMGFEQQDSQEFLTFLLDGLHEDLNSNGDKERLKNLTDEEEHRREQMTVRLASTIEWERYLKSNFSLIVDTVQGQLQSRLRCLTCNHTSTTYSAFSCLSLPIPLGYRQVTLHDCFNLFTGEEILDGDDAWICPKCKRSRRTSKILRIARLPSILIIHLKRFAQRGGRGYSTSDKLETFVTYPTSHLDLTLYWPKFAGPEEEQKLSKLPVRGQTDPFIYNLYAVANHFGSLKGGHYTAFVKKTNKGWCYFDDTRIMRQQPESAVINNNAYVLFYERQKTVR
jgi:ubiquitin carboxyl-terminal hydrolase 8